MYFYLMSNKEIYYYYYYYYYYYFFLNFLDFLQAICASGKSSSEELWLSSGSMSLNCPLL